MKKQIVGAKSLSTSKKHIDNAGESGQSERLHTQMRSRKLGSRCRTNSHKFLTPSGWVGGWKNAHTHAYLCTLVFSVTHTHTHLHSERETPAFPGQLTCGRTECRAETHQLSSAHNKQRPVGAAVHAGTSEPFAFCFIHLFSWLPCSLSMGWNWMWRMWVIGLRPDCTEPATTGSLDSVILLCFLKNYLEFSCFDLHKY